MSRHHLAPLACAFVLAASAAGAQSMPNINAPKQAAQRAAAAANAQLSSQTGQAVPTRSSPPAEAPIAAPGAPAPVRLAGVANRGLPVAPVAAPQVTREVFAYTDGGRRDPFFSLILTEDLRPLLSDLKLVGVLYEASGRRSVAGSQRKTWSTRGRCAACGPTSPGTGRHRRALDGGPFPSATVWRRHN